MAPWPSGKAKVCNTSIPGPIPGGASKKRWVPKRVPIFFCRCHHSIDRAFACLHAKTGSQFRPKDVPRLRGNSRAKLVLARAPSVWTPNGVLSFLSLHGTLGMLINKFLIYCIGKDTKLNKNFACFLKK